MTLSIASITVAYNGERRLPAQIDALLAQSRQLQEIVVIDNASTDNTLAMLAERYPQVKVIPFSNNVGAAGGFAAGLAYAVLEKKHDWVWILDDDSVPDMFVLDTLLTGAADLIVQNDVGMLAPVPVHEVTGKIYPPMLWRDGYVIPSAELLRQDVWFADLVLASGSLVRRETVEVCGVPRADFFMDLADFEYCLRIRSKGYKIAVISKCRFAHTIGKTQTHRILGFTHTWLDPAPWREYYISRNITYLVGHLYPSSKAKRFLISMLLRHAIAIVLFAQEKYLSLKMLHAGIADGRRAKLGIRFLPEKNHV